jgi:hypothetical protein
LALCNVNRANPSGHRPGTNFNEQLYVPVLFAVSDSIEISENVILTSEVMNRFVWSNDSQSHNNIGRDDESHADMLSASVVRPMALEKCEHSFGNDDCDSHNVNEQPVGDVYGSPYKDEGCPSNDDDVIETISHVTDENASYPPSADTLHVSPIVTRAMMRRRDAVIDDNNSAASRAAPSNRSIENG